ncbi:MAG: molybdenum cofactor guanylyltransferase [Clostridia bacterium]|nr:molybdenum cofactor guanylyltransferase [Clostridia bacterium]
MDLSAAILIGKSTRMGQDKALLTLDHTTFVGRLARELSVCGEVFISTTLPKDYEDVGLDVIHDEYPETGPLEGIRRSLEHARADRVFICAVDMPFVRGEMVRCLAERISPEDDICIFRDEDRIHPLCGIYRRRVLPVIEKMIQEDKHRMRELLSSVATKVVDIRECGFSGNALRNINTPEEYHAILEESGR